MKRAPQTEKQAGGVQSIEVGLRLLSSFIALDGPQTLKQIADHSGFTAPKAFRYLASFIRAGLVQREQGGARYQLGPLAAEIGFAAIAQIDHDRLARQIVIELAIETGFTACLTVWSETSPIVVSMEAGGPIYTGLRIGHRLPATRSASGIIFLAHVPAGLRRRALAEGFSDSAARARFEGVLDEARRIGLASAIDGVRPGLSGLAAPVFDHMGHVRFAVAVLGPSAEFDLAADGRVGAPLLQRTRSLSRQLGLRRVAET